MSTPNRIEVRPDGALVSGRHVVAHIRPDQALDVAVQLVTAAVRQSLLGTSTNPGRETASNDPQRLN